VKEVDKMARMDDSKKTRILAVIFVFLLVASTFGIMFSGFGSQKQVLEFNKYTFELDNNYWVTKVNKTEVKIQSNPYDLVNIQVDDSISDRIRASKMIYLAFPLKGDSPEYAAGAVYDLSDFLKKRSIYALRGASDDNRGYDLIPIIDCRNATANLPVILLASTNETSSRIVMEVDCVRLEAVRPQDFIALKDRLVLKIAGIA